MSQPGPPPGAPRGLIGFLDALRDGSMVVGWASDPTDKAARPLIRLMRGVEVLAECGTDTPRDDGNPGFRLVSPTPLTPQDFLEGRVRIRAMLPGRQAATTLAMTRRMRAALEDAAGWESTTEIAPPPRPAPPQGPAEGPPAPAEARQPAPAAVPAQRAVPPRPPPSAIRGALGEVASRSPATSGTAAPADPLLARPAPEPARIALRPAPIPARRADPEPIPALRTDPAPIPALRAEPAPGPESPRWVPAAAAQAADPPPAPAIPSGCARDLPAPLDAMLRLAEPLLAAGITSLHLLVPRRSTVVAGPPLELLTPLEEAAASRPALARGWLPLRHAFAHRPQPTVLWRADGTRLSVEGGLALMETLLAALRTCRPDAAGPLARIATLLGRAELTALPRRDVAEAAGPIPGGAFFGVAVRETEAVLAGHDLFYDMPAPRPVGEAAPGLEAWSSAGAPLPWRVLLLAAGGMGGSAGPSAPGWWLRHVAMECVFSEALATARPEAVIAARPDLVLTLAPEPPGPA